MQIADEIRKCVVFICYKTESETKLAGTGFFIGIPLEGTKLIDVYLITARHVIEGIQRKSADKEVYLRLNLKNGGARFVKAGLDRWVFHPQESNVDVAVLNWAPEQKDFEYIALPSKFIVTEDVIKEENIGVGDDVFVVGLFANHFGYKRNIPIVRVGNIASMPEEKVRTDYGDIDAYLVEARSIGGLSGSPVFAYVGEMRKMGKSRGIVVRKGRPLFYLLGLMHGHFDLSNLEIDNLVEDGLTELKINMGIAIVVPTWKILEVVNQEVFMKKREKDIENIKKGA